MLMTIALVASATASAAPISKQVEIDFFRDSTSRNLKGLATRSDGRIVAGPVFTELTGPPLGDLLWTLVPEKKNTWWIGTGPEGRILEVTLDPSAPLYAAREYIRLKDAHVFALIALPGGGLLAGTSPDGALHLVTDGKLTARVSLPVDSVFDLLQTDPHTVLAATGNPARIYQIDLRRLKRGGVTEGKTADARALEQHGITLFGEVRDRNLRRLAALGDGRIVAGSSPKGNLYSFSRDGGAPVVLIENRDAEVTDILAAPGGDLYAALVFSTSSGASGRINRPAPAATTPSEKNTVIIGPAAMTDTVQERFTGRSTVVWLPGASGFPETIVSRSGVAFYQLALRGDQILIGGGEQGEFLGYDITQRRSLTFPGSISSQLNRLAAVDGNRVLALRNNAPGLALIDFAADTSRELETRRLDVGAPARLGALRFNRTREISDAGITVSSRTNFGSDELEGWTPWTTLTSNDGGWQAADPQRGRYLQLRLTLPANASPSLEIDKAVLHYLPQNRRPTLTEFRLFAANFALLPAPEPAMQASTTLGQIMGQGKDTSDDKRRAALLSSAVVPAPGMQIAYWTLSDPDGDELAATFFLRRDGDNAWTDVSVMSDTPYAQFDTSHLEDGIYFTRLVVTEQSPRPVDDRLTTLFETDDLIVDRTAPEIVNAKAERVGDQIVVTVRGRDKLSLLEGMELRFNNGFVQTVEQPADGIRDSREETFRGEVPSSRIAPATNVEVLLYDSAGNSSARRLTW